MIQRQTNLGGESERVELRAGDAEEDGPSSGGKMDSCWSMSSHLLFGWWAAASGARAEEEAECGSEKRDDDADVLPALELEELVLAVSGSSTVQYSIITYIHAHQGDTVEGDTKKNTRRNHSWSDILSISIQYETYKFQHRIRTVGVGVCTDIQY